MEMLFLCLLPLTLSYHINIPYPLITASYSEDFARRTMLPLTAAAYSEDPQKCLTNTLGAQKILDSEIFLIMTLFWHEKAVSEKEKAIIIAFRGSMSFFQLVEEFDVGVLHKQVNFTAGGQVNLYFSNAFYAVWNAGLEDDFLWLKKRYPGYELWITGHSLGGAMASIAALYISANGLFPAPMIKLVTFGQPRTGNAEFANIHDRTISFSYRITHNYDMVPHVPVEAMGYTHHESEIFYHEGMTEKAQYTECDADEADTCSNGNLVDLSVSDHLHYFDVDISVYGEAGCVDENKTSTITTSTNRTVLAFRNNARRNEHFLVMFLCFSFILFVEL